MRKCKLDLKWQMRNKSLFLLFFLIPLLGFAQNAESIISQHLEKSGGVKNWRNLNSIILKGDVMMDLETSYPMTVYHKRPYLKKVVFTVNGKELLNEGYDGKNGYTYSDISGKNVVIKDYQPDSFDADIMDYDKKGFTAVYTGKSTSDNQDCYKVELTKNVNKITYCFSTKDYSLLWEENAEEKLFYYDYKKFEGLEFATRMVGQPKKGGEYVVKFYQIKINPTIDDKIFKF